MSLKILINASDPGECRVAVVKDSKLEEFRIESAAREITQGNIYKGIIVRIEPSLQAVFVDYGAERHGFLQFPEIHPDYFLEDPSSDKPLQNLVKRGQELMVQVTKDPFMKKGAMLTTYISLPGRYLVLMPGRDSKGISRKIGDEETRKRLREYIDSFNLPQDFGLIVRTAGTDSTKTMLSRDYTYLMRLWKTIKGQVMKVKAPALLYREPSLVLRSIRDTLTQEVSEILIDDPGVHQEVLEFLKLFSNRHTKIVKLYRGVKPLFSKFQLEDQIATIYENRVTLKSGGSIVIQPTEALVAIDVNSGKSTQEKSVEQTAYVTNLEAAEEIGRQLRLRDLGGLIVIDFIDMGDSKHRMEVERVLKNVVKQDRARTRVGRISKFGLLEMSRQRIRPSIEYGSYLVCSCCQGKGQVPSPETLGIGFLRKLSLETAKGDVARVQGIVPTAVADYLLNRKRKDLLELEMRREVRIEIVGDPTLVPGESRIVCDDDIAAATPRSHG